MVDVMGHLAMGLLWSLPAWFLWDERVSALFVAFAVLMAPVPDVDKYVAMAFPDLVHHHGVTHTVVFAAAISVVAGAIVAATLTDRIDGWTDGQRFDTQQTFLFSTAAFAVGGLSHVFADMLSAPDISTPIEPLWPFVDGSWGIDVLYYDNPWWNVGFLTLMVAVHLVAAYSAFDVRESSRSREI
ncbi:metal-dependent hydrolase [Halosimplex amylolyticum]|uniref:metal-dependent hydrolase n=1 Tax=Halosimplex amylolyticum TaxID=3396616 RepID=UPI003F54E8FE